MCVFIGVITSTTTTTATTTTTTPTTTTTTTSTTSTYTTTSTTSPLSSPSPGTSFVDWFASFFTDPNSVYLLIAIMSHLLFDPDSESEIRRFFQTIATTYLNPILFQPAFLNSAHLSLFLQSPTLSACRSLLVSSCPFLKKIILFLRWPRNSPLTKISTFTTAQSLTFLFYAKYSNILLHLDHFTSHKLLSSNTPLILVR